MSTRGAIENDSFAGFSDIKLGQLFYETADQYVSEMFNFWKTIDKNYTYCFELTAPENRIVTIYQTRNLNLLSMRDVNTLKELPFEDVLDWSKKLNLEPINNNQDIQFDDKFTIMEMAKALPTLDEGFVVVDYTKHDDDGISFKRLKVKSPTYVSIHHMKDRSCRSLRSLVSLVMDEKVGELLSYFPEYEPYTTKVQVKYDAYIKQIEDDIDRLKDHFDKEHTKENTKLFAQKTGKRKCINTFVLFTIYNGKAKTIYEAFMHLEYKKSRKSLEQYLVKALKLKETSIFSEV